jgi:hypothetical protein
LPFAIEFDINVISKRLVMAKMSDVLMRDLESDIDAYIRDKARVENKSLSEVSKEAVRKAMLLEREQWHGFLQDLDALRAELGPVAGNSTADIRAWREAR